jgi:hypothetical protein
VAVHACRIEALHVEEGDWRVDHEAEQSGAAPRTVKPTIITTATRIHSRFMVASSTVVAP